MKQDMYKGIFPALYTCYDNEGKVSVKRTQALAEMLINKGCKGLYVGGSSGECIYLTVEERKELLDGVMQVVGDRATIIAHVACNNTMQSMELAKHAESVKVNAIAAIPPIYFHLSDAAIAKYWNDISSAASNTDFIIYNIPALAGVALSRSLLKEMCKNPRVIGVKNSSMSTEDIQRFKAIGGENFVVFNGPDEQYIAGRAIGAIGGIGGTYGAMPELFLAMEKYMQKGDFVNAQVIQNKVNDIITLLCSGTGSMYAMIKQVLLINEGLDCGGVRKPLPPLTKEDEEIAKKCATSIKQAVSEL